MSANQQEPRAVEVTRICEFDCSEPATHYGGFAGAGDWAGYACSSHAECLAWKERLR